MGKDNSGSKAVAKRDAKVPRDIYEAELFRLQNGIGEAAGMGQRRPEPASSWCSKAVTPRARANDQGVTEYLSPRVARIVALPAPTERERGQWYFQRYVERLPARRGDRSVRQILVQPRRCRTRDGVLYPREHTLFLRQCPIFEQMLIDDGIILRKYWFSVSDDESSCVASSRAATIRCGAGSSAPWILSRSTGGEDYSRAKDQMMVHTDTPSSPWYVVESDNKKHAAQHDGAFAVHHRIRGCRASEGRTTKRTIFGGTLRPSRELTKYVDDHVSVLLGDAR